MGRCKSCGRVIKPFASYCPQCSARTVLEIAPVESPILRSQETSASPAPSGDPAPAKKSGTFTYVVVIDARIPLGRKLSILFEWAIAAIIVGFVLGMGYGLLWVLWHGLTG